MVSENNSDVNVYPNPSSGVFTFELLNKPTGPIQIEITDALGRIVERLETTEQSVSFHESNLAQEVYCLRVREHDKMVIKKIKVVK